MRPLRNLQKLSRNSESPRSKQDRAAHHDGGSRTAWDRFGFIARLLRAGCALDWSYARAKQRGGTWRGLCGERFVAQGLNEVLTVGGWGMRGARSGDLTYGHQPSRFR